MSIEIVDLVSVRRLIAVGVQLVEVLPADEYEELHLPGAINIPLKQLDAESVKRLDHRRDTVVYCWDQLCDMSPRAAHRLTSLGFSRVYDYAASKVDWLAHGLPAEGTAADRPTAGSLARDDAATCALDTTAGEALAMIAESPYGFALATNADGVLLGRVRRSTLETVTGERAVEAILEPGPSTIRPHEAVAELRARLERPDVRTLVVTRPDGTLVGVVPREDIPRSPQLDPD
ncbi:MAG: CBS domain-containing protein [Acidobacteriota bacterium]|nr:CBS domain-containing protein [Acidobacteriota bacterium]